MRKPVGKGAKKTTPAPVANALPTSAYPAILEGTTPIPSESWRPNWRKLDQYPNPSNCNRAQWTWEFMRRNAEYQTDFGRWRSETDQHKREQLERKWNVRPLPDPSENMPASKFMEWTIGTIPWYAPESIGSLLAWQAEAKHEFAIVFDLRLPLEHQLATAGRALKCAQEKLGRPAVKKPRKNKFLDYLRIIDALATEQGSESQVLAALANGMYLKTSKERARNAVIDDREQALYFLNAGYRDIRVMK